jgi:hypothetical protein
MKDFYWYIVLAAVLIGAIFNFPSLYFGAGYDDYYHEAFIDAHLNSRKDYPLVPRKWWDMFNFAGPSGKQEIKTGIENGTYPWWTTDQLRLAFFRPLSTVTQYLDYILWPKNPMLMHAQNIAWYLGIIVVLALYYRRIVQTAWIAGLALVIYCFDETRAETIGWIASRNTIVTAFFSILTLLSYTKWRQDDWKPGWVITPVLFIVALASGEGAWGIWAHFLAYALFFDRASPLKRVISLSPMVLISAGWRLTYNFLGYGTYGTFYYFDPINSPMRFLKELPDRFLACLCEFFLVYPKRPFYAGINYYHHYYVFLFYAAFLLIPTGVVLIWLLKSSREIRYWTGSLLIICIPLCTVAPAPRLFIFASMSSCPLIAHVIALPIRRSYIKEALAPVKGAFGVFVRSMQYAAIILSVFWLVMHLCISPVLAFERNKYIGSFIRYGQKHASLIPSNPKLTNKTMVIINTPDLFASLFSLFRRIDGKPIYPKSTVIVGETTSSFILYRERKDTLVIRFNGGFFQSIYGLFLRDPTIPIPTGYRVKQLGFLITVIRLTPDGRPLDVSLTRPSLDSPDIVWVVWNGQKYAPIEIPRVGKAVEYRAIDWSEYQMAHFGSTFY